MLDLLVFVFVPTCLNFGSRKIPVIVTSRKPICWCAETGHLSFTFPEKVSVLPATGDQNPHVADTVSSAASVMGLPLTRPVQTIPGLGLVPFSPQNRRLPQVRIKRKKRNSVLIVGVEGRAEQWGLSPMMTSGKRTTTVQFSSLALTAMTRCHMKHLHPRYKRKISRAWRKLRNCGN